MRATSAHLRSRTSSYKPAYISSFHLPHLLGQVFIIVCRSPNKTKQITKMIPNLALLPILPLLALAAPSSSSNPSTDALGLSEQDRAGLILRTLDAIERETRAGRTINFDAVLSPAQRDFLGLGARQGGLEERQLLGGGDDYAPYEMPCPDDYTWVRSADVSAVHCRNDVVRPGAKEDRRGESRWLLPRFDGSGELNTRA